MNKILDIAFTTTEEILLLTMGFVQFYDNMTSIELFIITVI